MHQPAVANRGQQKRERKIKAEHAHVQVALAAGNGVPRTKRDVVENPAIFAKRDFAFGPAIEIVENRFWNSFAREGTKIVDANYIGRGNRPLGFGHL
jgi:hypothetical protein